MGRTKKEGRRASGIQGKNGLLYIVTSEIKIVEGKKVYKKTWIPTGLRDTSENVPKAVELRKKHLSKTNVDIINKDISLTDYIDLYLEKKKKSIRDTTYSTYLCRGKTIQKYFGNMKIKDINKRYYEDFFESLINGQEMGSRTIKDTRLLLSQVLDQAEKEGLILVNPIKNVVVNYNMALKQNRSRSSDDNFFSIEEAHNFLQIVKDHELGNLFYVTLFYGLRREEVLGLRWSSINFERRILTINHTVTKGTKVNHLDLTKSKYSCRSYPIPDEFYEMFKSIKETENTNRQLFGDCYHENDYVFKNPDGSLYHPDSVSKRFRKIITRNPELPQGMTFHGLRKSCVSLLVERGNNIKSIQEWVGHADINTTLKIYALVKSKEAHNVISDDMAQCLSQNNVTNSTNLE